MNKRKLVKIRGFIFKMYGKIRIFLHFLLWIRGQISSQLEVNKT